MIQFLHVSDLHLMGISGFDDAITAGRLRELRRRFPQAVLLNTGDTGQDGDHSQYDVAAQILDGWPSITIPGNHDFGLTGLFYEERKAKRFDQEFGTAFFQKKKISVDIIDDAVKVIGINSNLETKNPLDFARGLVGRRQLCQLDQELSTNTLPTIVLLHHHPFQWWRPLEVLIDSLDFLKVCKGRVDVLLFGHRHKAGLWRDSYARIIGAAGSFPRETECLLLTFSKSTKTFQLETINI